MKTTSLALAALITSASLLLNAQADITTGLVGYWNLNDGPGASTAADSSGNGNIGTLKNYTDATYNNMWTTSTDPTNGWPYALMFTNSAAGLGANTYVNVPDSTSLNTPTANKAWTLAAWIYPAVAGASQTNNAGIISKGYNGAEAYAMYLSGGKVTGVLRNSANSGNETVSGNTVLAANTWYHVAVTVLEPKGSASAEVIIYVNGALDSGANGNTYTTDYSSSQPVTIGARMNGSGTVNLPFQGTIDEARIYNRALSSSDILQLYQNKAFTVLNSGVGSWNGLAGSGGNATLDSTSLNFCTNVYSAPVGIAASLTSVLNLESADALQLGGIFADTYYSSSKQTSVGATNLTTAAGGVSFATATAAGSLTFLNAATTYILNSSDSIGLKDNGANTTSLVQGGSGTVILTGVNTFGGGVTINSGTVQLGNGGGITGNELGTATTVNDNGTLAFNGNNSLSFASTIAGTGAVTQKGAGTLTLSTGNTYSGGTTVAGSTVSAASLTDSGSSLGIGPVNLNNGNLLYTGAGDSTARQFNGTSGTTNVIDVPSGVTLELSGRVTGSAAWYVNKNDAGTLTLSGNGDNSFLGMNVNAGTVILNKAAGHAVGQALTVASGATVQLAGAGYNSEINSNSAAPVTISSGGVLDAASQSDSFFSLTLSGTGIGGNGALINSTFSTTSTLSVPSITLAANTTIGGAGSLTLPGSVSGPGALTYAGTGSSPTSVLTLQAINTYSGGTLVSSGTLDANVDDSLPGNVTVSGTATLQLDSPLAMSSVATLTLPSAPAPSTVNLTFSGTQTIAVLMFGSTVMPAGTYGASATNPNGAFTGSGLLVVTGQADWDPRLLAASPGSGGTGTWDASTPNWFNVSADTAWPNDAVALFAGSVGTVTLGANLNADGLTFTTTGYTVNNTGGATLTLDGNNPTINLPTGSTTIGAIIAESGTNVVTINGPGTLALSGANTYANGTVINGVTLSLNTIADANCSIGPSGTVTMQNGSTLSYTGAGAGSTTRNVTASGAATCTLDVPAGSLTLNGAVRNAGGNSAQMYAKTGAGTLYLGGTNDNPSLTMAINQGALVITKASASTVHGLGGGTSIVASGATLQLAGSGNSDLYSGCILTVNSGGLFDLGGQSDTMSTLTISGTGLSGNGALINSVSATSSLTNNGSGVVLAGPTTIGGTGSITLASAVSGTGPITYAGTATLTLNAAGTYSGGTTINSAGTVQLNNQTAAGAGTIADNGTLAVNIAGGTLTNTVTGGSSSVLNFIETSGQNSSLNGPMSGFNGTINCPTSPGSTAKAQISSNCNLPATATNNVAAGGTLFLTTGTTNAATVILNGVGNSEVYGAFRLDTAAQTGSVILQTNSTIGSGNANGGVISGVISDGGHGYGFVKTANADPITLSGINTYSGATTISNGVLAIAGAGQLGSGNYAAPITNYGAFTYASSAPQTLSGVISGTGTLLQSGPGVLTLSGANTYTGGTLITNGSALTITGAGSLGGGSYAGAITNYGTFAYNGSAAQTLSGVVSGTGALIQSGSGTLSLSGANTYTGVTVITNASTLALASGGSINTTPSISIATGATLDVSAYTSYAMLGSIALNASGAGIAVGSTAATIKGGASAGATVTLAGPLALTFKPQAFSGDATHPALYVSQISSGQLVLSGSAITVNNAGGSPLGAGTYSLIQVASGGTISLGTPTVTVTGSGMAPGATASLSVSGTSLNLVVTGGAAVPAVNSIALADGNLVFGGTNGPNNHIYYVLGSSNVALPLLQWTPIETNNFGPTGAFSVTNAIGVGPWRFFIIQYTLP